MLEGDDISREYYASDIEDREFANPIYGETEYCCMIKNINNIVHERGRQTILCNRVWHATLQPGI